MPEVSLGEIYALVYKAYRGAGFSWGMAQEAGRAAAWLAAQGLPAASLFVDLLDQIDGLDAEALTPLVDSNQLKPSGRSCCPVVCGTVLSDTGASYFDLNQPEGLAIHSVCSPLILLPFVANIAVTDKIGLSVTFDGGLVQISSDGHCSYQALEPLLVSESDVVLSESNDQNHQPKQNPARRALVDAADLLHLESLAHRTYVPASEQSRSSGAGAGLTDND